MCIRPFQSPSKLYENHYSLHVLDANVVSCVRLWNVFRVHQSITYKSWWKITQNFALHFWLVVHMMVLYGWRRRRPPFQSKYYMFLCEIDSEVKWAWSSFWIEVARRIYEHRWCFIKNDVRTLWHLLKQDVENIGKSVIIVIELLDHPRAHLSA